MQPVNLYICRERGEIVMLETVHRYIEKNELLPTGCKVIVGLSGGADSMVLLDLLTLLGYHCVAAHCNFHLRGDESQRDADFVRRWCKDIDIPFRSIDFDTRQYAADRKISIEMAARELRYNWFEVIRQQEDAEAIAVAHHKDDSVETLLLNLIRGTGIRGLTGIRPKNGRVIRPLLCVTRSEIEEYLDERGIPAIFDSSNNDDRFLRNAIRLRVIPLLEQLNSSVKEAMHRTSQHLTEAEKVYTSAITEQTATLFQGGEINIDALKRSPSPSSLLFEILTPLGFNPSVIEDITESINATPGKQFLGERYRVIKDRDAFLVTPLPETEIANVYTVEEDATSLNKPMMMQIRSLEMPVVVEKHKSTLTVDRDLLRFPLLLRRWQAGDWFIPFGMKGRKKLSDFFTDRKMNLRDKEEVWVLLSGEDLVWIVGERPDNRFRVTEKTKRVLQIKICPENV